MKIKTGARILALSALTTMMFSAPALAKIEEGKLVIWINGDNARMRAPVFIFIISGPCW